MFEIKKINNNNFNVCKKFLLSVPSISEIDDEILNNAVIVFDNENIVGCVSYEAFNKVGLIRYFVFKKVLSESLIKEMFDNLESSAKKNGIDKLFCVVNNTNIETLFSSLDFNIIEKDYLYIDEELFTTLEYGSSNVMEKLITA